MTIAGSLWVVVTDPDATAPAVGVHAIADSAGRLGYLGTNRVTGEWRAWLPPAPVDVPLTRLPGQPGSWLFAIARPG